MLGAIQMLYVPHPLLLLHFQTSSHLLTLTPHSSEMKYCHEASSSMIYLLLDIQNCYTRKGLETSISPPQQHPASGVLHKSNYFLQAVLWFFERSWSFLGLPFQYSQQLLSSVALQWSRFIPDNINFMNQKRTYGLGVIMAWLLQFPYCIIYRMHWLRI